MGTNKQNIIRYLSKYLASDKLLLELQFEQEIKKINNNDNNNDNNNTGISLLDMLNKEIEFLATTFIHLIESGINKYNALPIIKYNYDQWLQSMIEKDDNFAEIYSKIDNIF